MRISDWSSDVCSSDLDCLAATIYHESRAEPLEGQLAVAEVVINRTQSPSFRRTICGVVTQPKQFSFVRNGAIPYPDRHSRAWKRSVAVARIARENLWSRSAANEIGRASGRERGCQKVEISLVA